MKPPTILNIFTALLASGTLSANAQDYPKVGPNPTIDTTHIPACKGSGSEKCGQCCLVWSTVQDGCVQAGDNGGFDVPCNSLTEAPFGSYAPPQGCDIWSMRKKQCFEWVDGREDGFTNPDAGPNYEHKSLASLYGTTEPLVGPTLTVERGKTRVVTSTRVVAQTSVKTVEARPTFRPGEVETAVIVKTAKAQPTFRQGEVEDAVVVVTAQDGERVTRLPRERRVLVTMTA